MASVTVPGASRIQAVHFHDKAREHTHEAWHKIFEKFTHLGQHGSPLVMPKRERDCDKD